MTPSVGGIDRFLRIVPLFTGLFRTCPLYSVIGVNTCPMKKGG